MTLKSTDPACPISAFGLVFMPTARTLATCASFRASEARDVSSFRFMGEIVDILAIFPPGHTLIVVSAMIPIAHAMRVADEQRSDPIGDTEIDDLPGCLMAQITDTTLSPPALFVLDPLQFLPASRVLLATGLLLGDFAKLLVALPLEGTDTTPCHDHGLLGIRSHSRKMDFSQIDCGVIVSRSLFSSWNLDTDVQFKAIVPDQATGPTIFWQIDGQDDGFPTFAHWQDHPSWLFADGLCGPFDRIEAFRSPGILHPHLRVGLAKFAGCLDVGKKCARHLLDCLTVQGKAGLRYSMQFVMLRPWGMGETRCLVGLHAEVPHPCRFHLSRFKPMEERGRKVVVEPIDTHRLHGLSLFALLFLGLDALILSLYQTVHDSNHALVGMSSDESEQVMRLDPNSHGLMWFFVHVGIVALYLHFAKGGVAFIPPPERGGSSRSYSIKLCIGYAGDHQSPLVVARCLLLIKCKN